MKRFVNAFIFTMLRKIKRDQSFHLLQINENLGTEMVFSLVSSAQEWLNVKWDDFKKEQQSHELEKQKQLEEAERVIFQRK